MTKFKLTAYFLGISLISNAALGADYGVRLGVERMKHECKFSNNGDYTSLSTTIADLIDPDAVVGSALITNVSKVSDCSKEDKPTIGIFMKNKITNKTFIETELAYVSKREFNSVYDVTLSLRDVEDGAGNPVADSDQIIPGNTQKIKVKSFPRLLLSIGHEFDIGNNFTLSPVFGIGYAQIKASGDQNSGDFIMREKTNNNFIWNIGASFSVPKSNWSVDYRYIDYGNVETQATQNPLADSGSEKLHGKMSSHTVSVSYTF